jgi:hypothetical protein
LHHEDGVSRLIDCDPDPHAGAMRIYDRLTVTGRGHQPLFGILDFEIKPRVGTSQRIRAAFHPPEDVLADVSGSASFSQPLVRRIPTPPIVAKEILSRHCLGMSLGHHGSQRVQRDRRRTIGASILVNQREQLEPPARIPICDRHWVHDRLGRCDAS